MTRVGIIGSRTWPLPKDVTAYVAALPPDTVVVSGGAEGPDTWAADAAKARGLKVIVHLPDLPRYGSPSAYYHRNKAIVADSDRIAAFAAKDPKTKDITAGTGMTIDLATRAGVPVEVIPSPVPAALCVLLHRLRRQLATVQAEPNQGKKRAMTKRLLALAGEVADWRASYQERLDTGYAEIHAETDDGEQERKECIWLKWLRSYEACHDALTEAEVVL